MRVYNQEKNQELKSYDLNKGRLVQDTLYITIPAADGQPQRQEVEEIMVYVPFSLQEQEMYDRMRYENLIENKIRQKYTLSQELAILRQRDSKIDEYNEYFAWCEECKRFAKEKMDK